MTKEEKAIAYDKIRNKITLRFGSNVAEEIFSEFELSEDERIRKALIKGIESVCKKDEVFTDGFTRQQIVDWLEKQGEQKPANSEKPCKDELKSIVVIPKFRIGDEIKTINEEPLIITKIDEKGYWSEDLFICDFDDDVCWDLVKQKPANKEQPKFKKGDWIIRSTEGFKHNTYLVTEVKDYYVCEDLEGRRGTFTFNDVHKNFKLWDVTKDAKDGDVLTVNNEVFIYAHRKQLYSIAVVHCFIDSVGGFYLDGEFGYTEKGNTIHPATKEQREQLEKAMHESGYEWYAEKKMLKKIEQKPIELAKGEDYGIDGLWHAQRILEKTLGKVEGYQSDDGILEHECAIGAVKELYEQKHAWSEEDEEILKETLALIETIEDINKAKDGFLDVKTWLKSLKDRYAWKPSDEQMELLKEACDKHWEPDGLDPLYTLYEDLKKLREE